MQKKRRKRRATQSKAELSWAETKLTVCCQLLYNRICINCQWIKIVSVFSVVFTVALISFLLNSFFFCFCEFIYSKSVEMAIGSSKEIHNYELSAAAVCLIFFFRAPTSNWLSIWTLNEKKNSSILLKQLYNAINMLNLPNESNVYKSN